MPLDWQPGTPIPGPSGREVTLASMANGDLVAGGWFLDAGSVVANHVARFDGSQWHAFGAGLDDNVYDIAKMPNGDLIVGGKFTRTSSFLAA